MVDAKEFPREKVCGGCVSAEALAILRQVGLGSVVAGLAAVDLHEYAFHLHGRALTIPIAAGIAVPRWEFDAALVRAAIAAGVEFLPATAGRLVPRTQQTGARQPSACRGRNPVQREVILEAAGVQVARLRTQLVLVADGLPRRSLRDTAELPLCVHSGSWIGLRTVYPASADNCPLGQVRMVIGSSGYVGTVQIVGDTINLAAAVSPQALKRAGSPAALVAGVLASGGVPLPAGFSELDWQGTGPLTQHGRRVAADRVFVIGDAAGYVEPFTGDGISHALAAALGVTQIILQSAEAWEPAMAAAWNRRYRRDVVVRQRFCRGLAALLHRPWALAPAFGLAVRCPAIPQFIAERVNRPSAVAALA